jgi:hypothetical protein
MPSISEIRQSPVADLVTTANVLRKTLRPEEGEISDTRLFLRCIGHAALGTELDDGAMDLAPVDPFALAKKVAGAVVSGEQRREMLQRFKDNLLPDLGLTLAMLALIPQGKKQGMSDKQAVVYATAGYAAPSLPPGAQHEIFSRYGIGASES